MVRLLSSPAAARVVAALRSRGETIACHETSSGGLLSASILATAGASRVYIGSAVVYNSRRAAPLLLMDEEKRQTMEAEKDYSTVSRLELIAP